MRGGDGGGPGGRRPDGPDRERPDGPVSQRRDAGSGPSGSVVLGDVAAGLVDVAGVFAGVVADPVGFDDGELVDAVRALELAQRMVDSARVVLVGELDARGEPARRCGLSTPGWLGHEFGLPRPVVGRVTGVARKLRADLSVVADALREGRISLDHASLIARLCVGRTHHIVVTLQEQFIDMAGGVRFEQWAREVRALVDLADPDGGHDPSPERNRVRMNDGLSGELHLDVTLVSESAAVVRAALLEETERRWRHHRHLTGIDAEHHTPGRAALTAEALVELIRRGITITPGAKAPVTDVTLVIQASDPVHAHTPDGVLLADGTTRILNCDPAIHALIIDTLGVPLDLGTTVRLFTPQQRRAVLQRDGGCIHPGCDAPPGWIHLHHVHHATNGGPTNIANAAPLCPTHHAQIHRTGWHIEPDTNTPDQGFIITTPTGTRLKSQRHGRPRPTT